MRTSNEGVSCNSVVVPTGFKTSISSNPTLSTTSAVPAGGFLTSKLASWGLSNAFWGPVPRPFALPYPSARFIIGGPVGKLTWLSPDKLASARCDRTDNIFRRRERCGGRDSKARLCVPRFSR
eukprot:1196073-Prorocentrum_minimum.AAC.4